MKVNFSQSYLVLPKHSIQASREKLNEGLQIVKDLDSSNVKSMHSFLGFTADIENDQTIELLKKNGFNVIKNKGVNEYISKWHITYPKTNKSNQPNISSEPDICSSSTIGIREGIIKSLSKNRYIHSTNINLPAIGKETKGKGITVGIIDSGVAEHPDLEKNIIASCDFVFGKKEHYDDMGHGTHVAGIVAGTGKLSVGKYMGSSPGAKIAALKVLGARGDLSIAEVADNIVSAIDWCVKNQDKYNLRVINMSLGLPILGITKNRGQREFLAYDPFRDAINRAVDAGITVVVSAGNDGAEGAGSIDEEPGINPRAITVGASDNKNTPAYNDDELAPFSSQGPTPGGLNKPDVLAPGAQIMSLNAPGSFMDQHNKMVPKIRKAIGQMNDEQLLDFVREMVYNGMLPGQIMELPPVKIRELLLINLKQDPTDGPEIQGSPAYVALDGTSMASPYVAGVVARMLEANPSLTPDQVKEILKKTAIKLPKLGGENQQGAGIVDALGAIKEAAAIKTAPTIKVSPTTETISTVSAMPISLKNKKSAA